MLSYKSLGALVCALMLALGVSACGSSSSSSSTSSTASSGTSTTGGGSGNRTALLACLKAHGITLGGGAGGGGGTGGASGNFQAARTDCAKYFPAGGSGGFRRLTPAQRAARQAATTAVESCMSAHGDTLVVTTPKAGASGASGASGAGGFFRGGGGAGGAGFGVQAALQKAVATAAGRSAIQACATQIAKLRTTGNGFGGGAGGPAGGGAPAGGAGGAAAPQ